MQIKGSKYTIFGTHHACPHKLVKKFMFHHIKRVFVEERHVGSKFPNLLLIIQKI
jgi:hypothetical protein